MIGTANAVVNRGRYCVTWDNGIMIYEGKKISEIRLGKGWSMAELARRSGIKQPSLWALEHQVTKKPKAETLLSISRALGVPLRDILSARSARGLVAAFDDLQAIFNGLDEQNRSAVLATAQALLNTQKK